MAKDGQIRMDRWHIRAECAMRIDDLFSTREAKYKLLGTNRGVWKKATTGEGVKKNTCRAIVMKYFGILDRLAGRNFESDDPHLFVVTAKKDYAEYSNHIRKADYIALIEPVVLAGEIASPPDGT